MGGSLTAANHPDGGAIFTMQLKRAGHKQAG
jgi:C4-dicarboxylate-specific signal transduction histidine kinase